MKELFRRIGYLLNRSRLERELESEMAFHREMAARHGGERFGNTLRLREEAREAWGWTWLDRLGQDLRYAARTLRRAPGFTIALGQRFEDHTVVGIARSARQSALQDPDAVEGYFPAGANDSPSLTLLVKAVNRAEDLSPSIAAVARSIDPALVPDIGLLKASFREKVQQTELTALAVGVLGMSALVLACVGIVGLVAYSVAQRTREIGIRMALGASGAQVVSAILGQLSRPVIAGLVTGLFAAALLSSVLRRELYGVSSLDSVAYIAAGGVFLVVVGLAALGPARRALAVDPLRALRCD